MRVLVIQSNKFNNYKDFRPSLEDIRKQIEEYGILVLNAHYKYSVEEFDYVKGPRNVRQEKWYQRRLAKYFTEHYEQYEDTAEFWNDPATNQWLFTIPELEAKIELTCKENGTVEEMRYPTL